MTPKLRQALQRSCTSLLADKLLSIYLFFPLSHYFRIRLFTLNLLCFVTCKCKIFLWYNFLFYTFERCTILFACFLLRKEIMTSLKDKLSNVTNKFAVTWKVSYYLGHLKKQINLLWCFSFIFKSISPTILPEIPSYLESHNYITFEMHD